MMNTNFPRVALLDSGRLRYPSKGGVCIQDVFTEFLSNLSARASIYPQINIQYFCILLKTQSGANAANALRLDQANGLLRCDTIDLFTWDPLKEELIISPEADSSQIFSANVNQDVLRGGSMSASPAAVSATTLLARNYYVNINAGGTGVHFAATRWITLYIGLILK